MKGDEGPEWQFRTWWGSQVSAIGRPINRQPRGLEFLRQAPQTDHFLLVTLITRLISELQDQFSGTSTKNRSNLAVEMRENPVKKTFWYLLEETLLNFRIQRKKNARQDTIDRKIHFLDIFSTGEEKKGRRKTVATKMKTETEKRVGKTFDGRSYTDSRRGWFFQSYKNGYRCFGSVFRPSINIFLRLLVRIYFLPSSNTYLPLLSFGDARVPKMWPYTAMLSDEISKSPYLTPRNVGVVFT